MVQLHGGDRLEKVAVGRLQRLGGGVGGKGRAEGGGLRGADLSNN